ncbi:short chain dehydrogenase reductase [Tricladium varicosporioides]|nr:short chain dehydrogenase reductase [Hymenoscyphus varicosporioides]
MQDLPSSRTIALVTGANRGIGLAVASQLVKDHNYHVIIGSRDPKAGQDAASSISFDPVKVSSIQLDLVSDSSIASAVEHIKTTYGRLDVLINNAGVLYDISVPKLPIRELFRETFETNVFGTACLTEALLALLRKSSHPRIVFVSSSIGSLTEATDTTKPFYAVDTKAYDSSKAAVNMLMLNYTRLLEDVGGRVNSVCPGMVNTPLSGNNPLGETPEVGAKRVVEMAVLRSEGVTGTFSDSHGSLPW